MCSGQSNAVGHFGHAGQLALATDAHRQLEQPVRMFTFLCCAQMSPVAVLGLVLLLKHKRNVDTLAVTDIFKVRS